MKKPTSASGRDERERSHTQLTRSQLTEKKQGLFERFFKKKGPKFKPKGSEEKPKEEKIPEKRITLFGKLLGKPEKKEEVKEEKPAKQKLATEFEELEQSIKKLGLFREIEEEISGKKKPEKKLGKFYKILNETKEAIEDNNLPKAKKLYAEARKLYVGLEYGERKEAYDELMDLYKQLLK